MPRLTYTILAFALLGLLACSQGGPEADNMSNDELLSAEDIAEIETKYSYVGSGEGAPVAKILISGMTCERMCVSKVNSTVAQLPGVMEMDMAFDADQGIDTLTVSFDPFEVDEKDIVGAIEGIAGGVYKVTEVQLTKDGPKSCAPAPKLRDKKDGGSARFSVPSIFDMLKRVSI